MKRLILLSMASAMALLTVSCGKDPGSSTAKIPDEAVDLGIVMTREDGTTYKLYWAKSNLDTGGLCANPEDLGGYYAWGETEAKSEYSWATYKFGKNSSGPFSKYNTVSFNGPVDNLTTLQTGPEGDDVASKLLGGKWRMPSRAEWNELRAKCKWTWEQQKGVGGCLVTASNGNSIFLPGAGFGNGTSTPTTSSFGNYWSSSLYTDGPEYAWLYSFNSSPQFYEAGGQRYRGMSVRPVYEE